MNKDKKDVVTSNIINSDLLETIRRHIPDAAPFFLERICSNKPNTPALVEKILNKISTMPFYPRISEDEESIGIIKEKIEPIPNDETNEDLVCKLRDIFNDACTIFLRDMCRNMEDNEEVVEELVAKICSLPSYPKSKENQLEILKNILPHADVSYLVESLKNIHSEHDLDTFVRNELENIPNIETNDIDEMALEDEAVALLPACTSTLLENICTSTLLEKISNILPDAEPNFLIELCRNQPNTSDAVDSLIKQICNMQYYPRLQQEPYDIILKVIPDVDPQYLKTNINQLNTPEEIEDFISNAIDSKKYPTLKKRNVPISELEKYIKDFTVENFIESIPNYDEYFNSTERLKAITQKEDDISYELILRCIENKYTSLSKDYIRHTYKECNYNMITTCQLLDITNSSDEVAVIRRKLSNIEFDELDSILIAQGLLYITHKADIDRYIEQKNILDDCEREQCISNGLMLTCNCCYNEVLPREIVECPAGHTFCNICLRTSVTLAFSEGKLEYPCLGNDCDQKYSQQIIQGALDSKLFSKIAQKKQVQEVKAAEIDEVEYCPFCEFATIPAPGDKLFKCLAPECMLESCRECKKQAHLPYGCNEEKDDEVKSRVYVENKMTEALVRQCKCGLKIIKEEGCNKMTCSCGATMCYVCKMYNVQYTHFNGQGGDAYSLCPLFCDVNLIHQRSVIEGAQKALAEVGAESLKFDPTTNIQQYYQ